MQNIWPYGKCHWRQLLRTLQFWKAPFNNTSMWCIYVSSKSLTNINLDKTSSVAAGFGRHGMPPPASNDTSTALGQHGSDWSRDLATLTFDLGGHGACGWCGSSSSICIPSLKFVGLAFRKIWCTIWVSINGPGDLDLWLLTVWSWNWYASRI